MREIKFRAWDKKLEEILDDVSTRTDDYTDMLNTTIDYIQNESDCVLMQYTGLKDKNGVEIYEGDIVLHNVHSVPKPIRKIIKFWEGSFIAIPYYAGSESHQSLINFAPIRTMEVIGNIYENTELLVSTDTKGKEDD